MTIEEKAVEWEQRYVRDNKVLPAGLTGYIAGAKENGIVWHDLRKNPDDLPEINTPVLVKKEGEWNYAVMRHTAMRPAWLYEGMMSHKGLYTEDLTAWCEIPKFEV